MDIPEEYSKSICAPQTLRGKQTLSNQKKVSINKSRLGIPGQYLIKSSKTHTKIMNLKSGFLIHFLVTTFSTPNSWSFVIATNPTMHTDSFHPIVPPPEDATTKESYQRHTFTLPNTGSKGKHFHRAPKAKCLILSVDIPIRHAKGNPNSNVRLFTSYLHNMHACSSFQALKEKKANNTGGSPIFIK